MAPASITTFPGWAEQTYGSSPQPAPNAHMVSELEELVALKHLEGLVSHHPVPPKQTTPVSSNSDFSLTSRDNEFCTPASTEKTTPERSSGDSQEFPATTCPTRTVFATTTTSVSLEHTEATSQEDTQKLQPEAEMPPLEIGYARAERLLSSLGSPDPVTAREWYRSLSRFEQLEYFARIKVETFRDHVGVHISPLSRQACIDREEVVRRHNFYLKNGGEAYWARYIDSNYTGHNEFLYIDPEEVQWK